MRKRIYISGAITETDYYLKRFGDAEADLTTKGYSVINPAKVNAQLPKETTYDEYMKMSMCMLEMCDSIYMLSGWQKSKGANMERERAKELNMGIMYQGDRTARHEAINEFYTAIENHYKIYKCTPSMEGIREIAENMKK